MEKKQGHYLGTEIEEKWWRRYTRPRFFARGSGEYWYDGQTFYFRRYLTQSPLVISLWCVSEVQVGRWHCGRWAWGAPVVKLIWENDGLSLSSGFVLSGKESQTRHVIEDLQRRLSLSAV